MSQIEAPPKISLDIIPPPNRQQQHDEQPKSEATSSIAITKHETY